LKIERKEIECNMEDKERKPCLATFTGTGGYEYQREQANKVFEVGKQYLVIGGLMDRAYTSLRIEGIPGDWNSVLFDFDYNEAPLSSSYYIRE
jgi:hypothetical protein